MINTDTFISITGSKEYIFLIFPIPGYAKLFTYSQLTEHGTICKKSFFMINTYPLLVLKNKFSPMQPMLNSGIKLNRGPVAQELDH